jgi:opacity protein-like surface antigen
MRSLVRFLAVIATFSTCAAGQAQDWPRMHIGVAAGDPHWSVDISEAGVPLPDPIVGPPRPAEPSAGWKLVGGFRPARVVGVEIQYVDLGEGEAWVNGGWSVGGGQVPAVYQQSNHMKASFDATVLSALLFIPETSPSLDVYGKIGVADLNESLTTSTTTIASGYPIGPECVPYSRCTSTVNSDVELSESAPYVGIGARVKIASNWALRVEYEGIARDVGDAARMLSLGIAWEH